MLGEDERDRGSGDAPKKGYLRSVSWSDRSPSKPFPRPQGSGYSGSKQRSCLPPLQPLSISRRSVEEWPRAGSDDLGVWPNPPTPGGRKVSIKPLEISDGEQHAQREFLFKKDKLAFFDKECSRIAEHIYLGSDAVAKNREILKKNGITHVLNCVGFVCPEYFKNDLVYKTLWLQDSPSEDITSILYDVFDYFEDVREQKGRVLVHCCQGVSRSTSLVIAYLMWRDGQSFEDAFQYVKSARGVTNPNMGFACQLLQCQKRVHAAPISPNSALRVFRMAPHSPYAPLHLVPKMLNHPGAVVLDSRGAFIVHVPTSLFVWIGKNCNPVMANSAKAAAFQVVRYERAEGPIVIIQEGEEPIGFWEAITGGQGLGDLGEQMNMDEGITSEEEAAVRAGAGKRMVDKYDTDFEIFFKALDGGVVPPFPLSGAVSETHLPARGSGWGRLRQKFTSGIMKGFLKSSKVKCDSIDSDHGSDMIIDTPTGAENTSSPKDLSCSSPGSDQSPSPGSPDSFSHFLNDSPKVGFKSPSLSPSTSDYASSFSFSPSSSNWSDYSGLCSRQPSPSGLESNSGFSPSGSSVSGEMQLQRPNLIQEEELFHKDTSIIENTLPLREGTPSIAERRGGYPSSLMLLPSVDKPPRVPRTLVRSSSFSLPELEIGRRPLEIEFNMGGMDQMLHEDSLKFKYSIRSDCMTDVTELALHQWPLMTKVEIRHFEKLDSKSVYIISASDLGLIYVWFGSETDMENTQSSADSMGYSPDDFNAYLEVIGDKFFNHLGLPTSSTIQVVKEGYEPQQFLDLINLLGKG